VDSDLRVVVVGGGPAGITAALQARELGAQVTLLEAGHVGDSTLNRGPAPVRTLARAARLARDWSSWAEFGLAGPPPVPDLPAMIANSERVARHAREKRDVPGYLRQQGINLAEDLGPVRFTDPVTLTARAGNSSAGNSSAGISSAGISSAGISKASGQADRTWTADRIILAVGGHAARLPIPGAELALTYEDLPGLETLPRRVAVIGGADTGCQLASIFDDLGAAVTVYEAGAAIIPAADADVSAELCRAFRARDMTVATETIVTALSQQHDGIRLDYRAGESAGSSVADAVFMAVGWPASTATLDLCAAGVAVTGPAVTVDDCLRTSVPHIFAAGDVTGHGMLVQTARMEGRIAAKNAVLGTADVISYDVIPSGSFTDPEYGRVGLTEAAAAASTDVVVGIARYSELLRPVADGRTDGFCKLIADRRSHRLLGAHVLGEYSAETVQTVAACMAAGLTVEHVAELQFAFPTFTEGVSIAAQMICRDIGIGRFPQVWSYLGAEGGKGLSSHGSDNPARRGRAQAP
jgi:pyruvate/2-oxoglutarate dehydrogenase complex dihydrolipoamide dehydrogenase (E3) component